MTHGYEEGAEAEPARSVHALLTDLGAVVRDRTGSGAQATVRVRRRGVDQLVAATGEQADRVDTADGAAPWRTVLDARGPVALPDLRGGSGWGAWPVWRAAALAAGFGSAVVVRAALPRGGGVALSLYLEDVGAASTEVVRRAGGFAGQIASLIGLHSTIPARERPAPATAAARRSRASVEQAVGVLMEVRGCDEPEARHVLTVLAGEQGRTLESVAGAVLDRALRPVVAGPVPPGLLDPTSRWDGRA